MIVNNKNFAAQLARAVAGDSAAMSLVLQEYEPLFRSRSMIDGELDEDCYQYILLRAIQETPKFKGIKIFFRRGKKSNKIFLFP